MQQIGSRNIPVINNNSSLEFCPFQILKEFLEAQKLGRRSEQEQFFIFKDRSPSNWHSFQNYPEDGLGQVGFGQFGIWDTQFESWKFGRFI